VRTVVQCAQPAPWRKKRMEMYLTCMSSFDMCPLLSLILLYVSQHRSLTAIRRVDRVLSFSPDVRIGTPPTPSSTGECVPLFGWGGGYTFACGRGGGGSQFRRGDRQCDTLGMYVKSMSMSMSKELRSDQPVQYLNNSSHGQNLR
jgi:hypothetical protein